MKAPETTVTLPRIAVAIAAALAVTATVLAIPTFAQATTTRTAAVAGIKLDRLTSPITAGAYASLAVRTSRPATCSISVYYKSGPSQAAGLYPKRGTRISWTWKVGTRTTPGSWPILVSCGSTGSLRTFLTVT